MNILLKKNQFKKKGFSYINKGVGVGFPHNNYIVMSCYL